VLNQLVGSGGLSAELAEESFEAQTGGILPAGTVLFAADHATRVKLATAGRENGLLFRRIVSEHFPSDTDPIDGSPRIAVITGAVNQDIWSLRNLGFDANPVGTTTTINSSPTDPLAGYDIVWNTGNYPSTAQTTARARFQAFFAAGGGYIGTGAGGANFLTTGGLTSGLTTMTSVGPEGNVGESGIIRWVNEGADSPIAGAYPATDTAIVDPPIWFTAVPASFEVDARLPLTNFFLSGMWHMDAQSASAPGSAFVVHGVSTAGSRVVNFAMSPLYRADPEREWPMVGTAAYWVD
jgi:hypothetical protein